jgi:uncharacterized protein (TIGR03382 family)
MFQRGLSMRSAAPLRLLMVAGVVGAAAASASADISDVVFRITATGQNGDDVWVARLSDGGWNPDGSWSWNLAAPVELRSESGALLGTLTQAGTHIIEDPQITLGFFVQAGNVPANFVIQSALLSFPTMTNPDGRMSGSVTVTDGGLDGATLTGNQAGGDFLWGQYNGVVPTGTTFATIIQGPLNAAPGLSDSESENLPPGVGFMPIAGNVSDMSLQWAFTLSANDVASGTGTYIIVPGPAGAGVLGLAGLAVLRRRR